MGYYWEAGRGYYWEAKVKNERRETSDLEGGTTRDTRSLCASTLIR